MKRYAKTALWITFGLLFVLIIVKVFLRVVIKVLTNLK